MKNVNKWRENSVCASRAINFLCFFAPPEVLLMQLEVIHPAENEVDVRVAGGRRSGGWRNV